ncbi:vacuolar protein sorting-associated protein 18 isoform 2, partial [Aphelenchoides avenae]
IRLELAKECAFELNQKFGQANDFSPDDLFADPDSKPSEETRKRVWMEIAKHMITASKNDVQVPLQLLKESGDAIKIQDILSYFPEFTKIEHFKEPVCDCLKEHSRKIQDLQQEMKETHEMAQEIRRQLEKAKTKFMVVKAQDTCTKCKELLLTRPFYAFVCRHFFHKECLYAYLQDFFTEQEKALMEKLTHDEKVAKKVVEMKAGPEKVIASKRLKIVQDKLKTLIADDCPACGSRMIESIDKPFFTDAEYRQELATWTFPY